MGYSRKYPPPPPPPQWMTLNRVLKNFKISKNDSSHFCRIPNLADSKYWGIPEFCKTLNDFRGISVKIHKILRKFMDFQSILLSIFYRISNVVRGGCVDIFWKSPISSDWMPHFVNKSLIINPLARLNRSILADVDVSCSTEMLHGPVAITLVSVWTTSQPVSQHMNPCVSN